VSLVVALPSRHGACLLEHGAQRTTRTDCLHFQAKASISHCLFRHKRSRTGHQQRGRADRALRQNRRSLSVAAVRTAGRLHQAPTAPTSQDTPFRYTTPPARKEGQPVSLARAAHRYIPLPPPLHTPACAAFYHAHTHATFLATPCATHHHHLTISPAFSSLLPSPHSLPRHAILPSSPPCTVHHHRLGIYPRRPPNNASLLARALVTEQDGQRLFLSGQRACPCANGERREHWRDLGVPRVDSERRRSA